MVTLYAYTYKNQTIHMKIIAWILFLLHAVLVGPYGRWFNNLFDVLFNYTSHYYHRHVGTYQ
jgi:hypothetical protein